MWRYIAKRSMCCVVGPDEVAGTTKPTIPNEKVMLIGCDSEEEAYFVCGVLSASPVRTTIDSRIIGTQIFPTVISNIAVPTFAADSEAHTAISELCRRGHEAGGYLASSTRTEAR